MLTRDLLKLVLNRVLGPLRVGLSRKVQVDGSQVLLRQLVERVLNNHRLTNTSFTCEEDRFPTAEKEIKEISVLVGHLSLDHNVEEGLVPDWGVLRNLLLPRFELMLFQVVPVIEDCEGSWELGRLELLSDCRVKVVLRFVAEARAEAESVRECEDGKDVLLDSRVVSLEDESGLEHQDLEDIAHGAQKLQVVSLDGLDERV